MENHLMPVGLDLIACTLSSRKSLSQRYSLLKSQLQHQLENDPLQFQGSAPEEMVYILY